MEEKEDFPPEVLSEYGGIFSELRKIVGVDFSQYKVPTIQRRVHRRMALLKSEIFKEYAAYLREHRAETEKLYADLLINVTLFFATRNRTKPCQSVR